MDKKFLIGDDGKATWNTIEIKSIESVSFSDSRTDITSSARGSDRVNHRTGKRDTTFSLNIRVEPDDQGLALLLSSFDDNEPGVLKVEAEDGDVIEEASYKVQDTGGEQPLEEAQTYSIELVYYSDNKTVPTPTPTE